MSDEQAVAEREYQRRLAALHATRAEIAEVDAALHRVAIDRSRLGPVADAHAAELGRRREALLDLSRTQRGDAQVQREVLDRYRGPGDPEPVNLPPDVPDPGRPAFVQPPFGATP